MNVGISQKEARGNKFTQQALADELNLSRSMIAEIESGRRRMPKDVAPKAVQVLNDGFYAMEIASESAGGTWVTKLNGEKVDLHRASVKEKAMEELYEAIESIRNVSIANIPNCDKSTREELKHVLNECLDVIVCLSHFVAVICRDYSFSWVCIWKQHRKKLSDRGYLKDETKKTHSI